MWRPKAPQFKTANLCNQFLVIYLTKKKSHLDKINLQRKAMTYNTAIISIKKYPLPIISTIQLKTLYGIGEMLCEELQAVIKHHYRQFLKEKRTTVQCQTQEINSQLDKIQNSKEEGNSNRCHSVSFSNNKNQKMNKTIVESEDSRSLYSIKSVSVDKPYKPRPKSQASFALQAIRTLSKSCESVGKQMIRDYLKNEYQQAIGLKAYQVLLVNLVKGGYLQINSFQNTVKLTEIGAKHTEALDAKTKVKDSQLRIKNMLTSFKNSCQSKQLDIDRKPEQRIKQKVQLQQTCDIILLIDCREIKDKTQQSFFQSKLSDKYLLTCRTANLPIGDFLWMYDGQILDYVVERKKADDLASSIHDGRYKQQKFRLKNSGVSNVYYLYQGFLTGNNAKLERQVSGALMNTRVKQEMKVVQVGNITESLKFINVMTKKIRNKLDKQGFLNCLGTLQEFTLANGKASQLTVQHIFGLSLKTVPGVGKNSVNQLLKYFNCYRQLYNKLLQLDTRYERIEFLRELVRGCGVRNILAELVVDMLFDTKLS